MVQIGATILSHATLSEKYGIQVKYVFGINDALVEEIRKEFTLRRLAIDEDGEVLVWMGETQPIAPPAAAVPSQPTIADTVSA